MLPKLFDVEIIASKKKEDISMLIRWINIYLLLAFNYGGGINRKCLIN